MRTLILALNLLALSAQAGWRDPSLTINLEDPGRIKAWLSLPNAMPEAVARAFTRAMGCPADALSWSSEMTRVNIECPASVDRSRLRWSTQWDLTALASELKRAGGADSLELEIYHPRYGFSTLAPPLYQSHLATFNVGYQGELRLDDAHLVRLEAGYGQRQIGTLAAVAAAILLLPLVLFGARSAGPLHLHAASNGLFLLEATAWLSVTLPLDATAIAPLPWNLILMSAPLLAAVWIASRIAGGTRGRALLWRGVRGVAFVLLLMRILNPGQSIMPWAVCCLIIVLVSFLIPYRAGVSRVQTLGESDLLNRVRQLAARAGASIKSVQLIAGKEDQPAAFATRFRGVLLTRSLITKLDRREVDAIVAHELSHIRRPNPVATRGIALVVPVAIFVSFLLPDTIQWMPLLLFPSSLLYAALRRRNERRADADAVAWSGDAEALISGLARVTRAHAMPLEWPRWIAILLTHPPTIDRLRAAQASAHISEERFAQILAGSLTPPFDSYSLPPAPPEGAAFNDAARKRLILKLTLLCLATPVIFGVASPYLGSIVALILGALTICFGCEWVVWRARWRGRALLAGRPGIFVGLSPSPEPRIYEGSYDYDWGFLAFEDASLVFRGDCSSFSVPRAALAGIRVTPGPFAWFPEPLVRFEMIGGQVFTVRPFDGAAGPSAPRAARRLQRQAEEWRARATQSGDAAEWQLPAAAGQPQPRYTIGNLVKSLPRFAAVTLVIHWTIYNFALPSGVAHFNLLALWGLGPVLITCCLCIIVAIPPILRTPPVPKTAESSPSR